MVKHQECTCLGSPVTLSALPLLGHTVPLNDGTAPVTVNTATLTAVGAAAESPIAAGNSVRLTSHTAAVQMATATPPPMTIELGTHGTATSSLPLTTGGPLPAATASHIAGHTATGHTTVTQIATATPPIAVELGNHNTDASSLQMTATSLPMTAAEAETEPLTGQTVRFLSCSGGSQLSGGGGTLLLNPGSTLKVNGRLLTGLPATAVAVGTTDAVSTKVTLSPLARAQPTLPSLNRYWKQGIYNNLE
mgnify:CR=1 FL=1